MSRTRHPIASRLILCAATALCAACRPAAAALPQREVETLFQEGTYLFRQANERVRTSPEEARELYRNAAMRFERIVREGDIHNGKLHYNIGNAYFRMEDLGRAILNYRRAESFIPHDADLQQNLQYARSKRLDRIDEQQRTRVLKTLFFWHYDLSARARSLIFAACFAVVWVCGAARLIARRAWLGWTMALGALLAALFLGSLVVENRAAHRDRPGVVLSGEVVARKGDSETYEPSFTEPLHAGTEFTLVEARTDWYHVRLADGRCCWLPAQSAELVRH